jgi:hypothetical protein
LQELSRIIQTLTNEKKEIDQISNKRSKDVSLIRQRYAPDDENYGKLWSYEEIPLNSESGFLRRKPTQTLKAKNISSTTRT